MDAITLAWMEAGQRKTQTFVDTYSTKNPGAIRIGRDPAQCDVVLPSVSASDRTVSRLHVEIAFNPSHSSFYLRNLKPQNPVQVDGSSVEEEALLKQGSIIRLGKVELEVASVAAVPATIFVSASERPTLVYKPTEEPADQITELPDGSEESTNDDREHAAGQPPEANSSVEAEPQAVSQPGPPPQPVPSVEPIQQLLQSIPIPTFSPKSLLKPVPLAIGATILAALGILQWQRLNTITSTKAFINSRIVPIDAPVSGELRLQQNLRSGQSVLEGTLLANIYDPRNVELQRAQQRLKSDLENLIYRQRQLQVQLTERQNSIQRLEDEANAQFSVQQGSTAFLEEELNEASVAAREAAANLEEVRELAADGTVSEEELQLATDTRDRADELVRQLRAQLDDARSGQGQQDQAASVNTVIETRRRSLLAELENFETVLSELQAEADGKQREFDSVTERLSRQTPANIISPADGEIWTVEYQAGLSDTVIVSGDRIAELAQCDGLWIEAFVSGHDASHIEEGGEAKIVIPEGFGSQTLTGIVRDIRTSADPVDFNADDIAIAPEELVAGEVAVTIDLKSPEDAVDFCNIGRTTEVKFSRS